MISPFCKLWINSLGNEKGEKILILFHIKVNTNKIDYGKILTLVEFLVNSLL